MDFNFSASFDTVRLKYAGAQRGHESTAPPAQPISSSVATVTASHKPLKVKRGQTAVQLIKVLINYPYKGGSFT